MKGLYIITPENPPSTEWLISTSREAVLGGASIIQYRDKSRDNNKRIDQATQLARLCREYGVMFIINDDPELAKQSAADGVHLGKDDLSLQEVRDYLGKDAIIGVSCYNDPDLALQAQQNGANYVAFGRFFPSTSKPLASPAEMKTLQIAKENLSIPIAAIGGITPGNLGDIIRNGADMLAVIHGVYGQNNSRQAAENYQLAIQSALNPL